VAAAVGGVGVLVAAGLARSGPWATHPVDRQVRRSFRAGWPHRVPRAAWWFGGHHTRHHALTEALGGLAGEGPTLAAGALAAAAVARRRGLRPAVPVLAAVPLALAAHAALKYTIRRPRPLWARLTGKHTPSFPSGHAARGAAAAGIVGYVAGREGVVPAGAALPLGAGVTLAALAGGASRVYVDRHWATDAVGGWGLGTAVAALCALWCDRLRPPAG
jgi:membrane-associated phospholipid phosphatase